MSDEFTLEVEQSGFTLEVETPTATQVLEVAVGIPGASAYGIALANGFEGDVEEWLASLQGEAGEAGPAGNDGADGAPGNDGAPGEDGESAYDIAVANGFVGTEAEWLDSLVGEQGEQGEPGSGSVDSVNGDTGPAVVLDAADVGADPAGTAASEVSTHNAETTSVHGIADTADLVLDDDARLTDARTPTGAAGGVLGGTYPDPSFAADMATQAELDGHASDTTSVHGIADTSAVVLTDDSRLTDSRTPTGTAGGDLSGTYPNPSVTDDSHAHTTTTISDLDAADITTGTFDDARIPSGIARDSEVAATYAPLASPTFTGAATFAAVVAPLVVGALATTAVVAEWTSTATNDDPKLSLLQGRLETTTGAAANLVSSATATDLLPASGSMVAVFALVEARQTASAGAGTVGNGAFYIRAAAFTRDGAGTTTQIGTTAAVATMESEAGWDCTIDTSSNNVRIRVTGAANETITWHAHVFYMKLAS